MSNAHNFKADKNIIQNVPQSLCYRRHGWNSRLGRAGESIEEGGFKGEAGLVESIVTRGQDEPICLRLNPEYQVKGAPGEKFPYEVVTGFGRFEAIRSTAANEQADVLKVLVTDGVITHEQMVSKLVADPTIRATIEVMTDEEARIRNIEENVARSQLSRPDFAYGVADLKKVSHQSPTGTKMTDAQIASRFGCSQAHVSTIGRIYNSPLAKIRLTAEEAGDTPGKPAVLLLDHWRAALVKLPYKEMDLLTKIETVEGMKKAYLAQAGKKRRGADADSGVSGGKGKGADNAAVQVKIIGTMMGSLARQGVLKLDDAIFSTSFACELAAPVQKFKHDKATEEQREAIIKAFRLAFETARDTVVIEETAEAKEAKAAAASAAKVLAAEQKNAAAAKAKADAAAAKETAAKAKADAKAAEAAKVKAEAAKKKADAAAAKAHKNGSGARA